MLRVLGDKKGMNRMFWGGEGVRGVVDLSNRPFCGLEVGWGGEEVRKNVILNRGALSDVSSTFAFLLFRRKCLTKFYHSQSG